MPECFKYALLHAKQELIKINTFGKSLCALFTKSLKYKQIENYVTYTPWQCTKHKCNILQFPKNCQQMSKYDSLLHQKPIRNLFRKTKKVDIKTCANANKLIVHTYVCVCA